MTRSIREKGADVQSDFGLVAWLESTRVVLPLRLVDCRFEVLGELVSVQIQQVFIQNNPKPLDCYYTFPLPAGAAVNRCEIEVNGRVIVAKVMEKSEARSVALAKKAAGFRTGLVETIRENLFSLELGNVQPGDRVVVRLGYFEGLQRLGDWSSFHIPFSPGRRYIPGKPLLRTSSGKGVELDTDQVPDASRISPPELDSLSEDAAQLFISGKMDDALGVVEGVSSPSHEIVVKDTEGSFLIGLSCDGHAPDRDFVLRWREREVEEVGVVGWSWVAEADTYAMIRILPPAALGKGEHQVEVEKDVYFLLDHSSSMEGMKWNSTARAFLEFLKTMGSNDRVWLTLFNSAHADFCKAPVSARVFLRDKKVLNLRGCRANGGTELMPALRHVIQQVGKFSANRRALMVLITDGQVGNESEIVDLFAAVPDLALHVLGIDMAPNDALMKALGARSGSSWHQMHPNDDLVETVRRVGRRLNPAVLNGISVSAGWEPGGEMPQHVHAGESRLLLLKNAGNHPSAIHVKGITPGGLVWEKDLVFRPSNEAVKKLWEKRAIEAFWTEGRSDAAIGLAIRSNLLCRGTSFIAWDESEKVVHSTMELVNPVHRTLENRMMSSHFGSLPYMPLYSLNPPVDLDERVLEPTRFRDLRQMDADVSEGLGERFARSVGSWDTRRLSVIMVRLLGIRLVIPGHPELSGLWNDVVIALSTWFPRMDHAGNMNWSELEQILGSVGTTQEVDGKTAMALMDCFAEWLEKQDMKRVKAVQELMGKLRLGLQSLP